MGRFRRLLPGCLVLLLGLGSYWLVQREASAPPPAARKVVRNPAAPTEEAPPPPAKSGARDEFADGTTIEIFGSCRDEELILRFPTPASFDSFIVALDKGGVRLIDRLDRLRAMRVGGSAAEMEILGRLFEEERITVYKSLAQLPSPPQAIGGAQRGEALAFGAEVLKWLGVSGDNSRWGSGVKVAVLDSGVVPHPGLPRNFRSIEIFPSDPTNIQLHGTAVASLIVGTNPMARGLAPAADLISISVLDHSGTSDAYAIAAGLLAAMDAGAQIVNLSLGTEDDCPLLGEAIRMVLDAGIVVVASSGNEGLQATRYPAAYPGVIAVGAIDASAERMAFSNVGGSMGIAAPGFGVNAAAPGDRYVSISGTSASAPLVTAAIAATMSNGSGYRLTAKEAAQVVLACADDEGPPGPDSEYGNGVLNLDRIMNRQLRGRYDAAITCLRVLPPSSAGRQEQVEVTVQNRGTETLINSMVEITTPAGVTKISATTIPVGASQSFTALLSSPAAGSDAMIAAQVLLASGSDLTPDNNSRAGRWVQGVRAASVVESP